MSEAEGADEVSNRRTAMQNHVGDSFPTISSTGSNAAVIHYQPSHENCKTIDASQANHEHNVEYRDFLLVECVDLLVE